MGIPITILDKYCPEQFEILTIACGNSWANYSEQLKKLNFNPNIKYGGGLGSGVIDGKGCYARILIKHKKKREVINMGEYNNMPGTELIKIIEEIRKDAETLYAKKVYLQKNNDEYKELINRIRELAKYCNNKRNNNEDNEFYTKVFCPCFKNISAKLKLKSATGQDKKSNLYDIGSYINYFYR